MEPEVTFSYRDGDESVTVSFQAVDHYTITNRFINFLRGAGFTLPAAKGNCDYDIADLIKLDNKDFKKLSSKKALRAE